VPTRPGHDSTRSAVHAHSDDSKCSPERLTHRRRTLTNTGSFEAGKRTKSKSSRRHQSMPKRRIDEAKPRRITRGTVPAPQTTRNGRNTLTSGTRLGRRQTATIDSLKDGGRGKHYTTVTQTKHEVVALTGCQRRATCVPGRRRMTASHTNSTIHNTKITTQHTKNFNLDDALSRYSRSDSVESSWPLALTPRLVWTP